MTNHLRVEDFEGLKKQIELETKKEREARLAKAFQDPDRPQYHYQPSPGWMNDPNGPLFWKGEYHMFHQYSPDKPYVGLDACWGHIVSKDLVHWRQLPIALAPTPGGPDKDGCWSGMTVDNDGVPTIIYTGVQYTGGQGNEEYIQTQCIATSKDDMLTWQKYEGNPVIDVPPEGLTVTAFRDPCAWKEGDTWYVIIGSGIEGVGGISLLYKSRDLIYWEYMHPLYAPDRSRPMDECPDFFSLSNKYVLLTSVRSTHWDVGTYTDHKFIPEKHGKIDWGNYYAAKTMVDERGRRIIWGWITEGRSVEEQFKAGWSGVLSLPRVLSLLPEGTLQIEPVSELKMLRGSHWSFRKLEIVPSKNKSALFLDKVQGNCLEIVANFAPNQAKMFGLIIQGTDAITYDREKQQIAGAPLPLRSDEDLFLQIYVDRSVIEIFANGQVCKTLRTYHQTRDNLDIGIFAKENGVKVKSIDIWKMKSIKAKNLY